MKSSLPVRFLFCAACLGAAVSAAADAGAATASGSGDGIGRLEQGFREIPDSIQTAVYWYWISDNISKDGVIKDLHAMKSVGINRAFLGSMGVDGVPYGDVKFLSDEWWDITQAALKTASDLGIEIGIFNSPGWSQSGGPWVRPDQAMRYVGTDTETVEGNGTIRRIGLHAPSDDAVLFKVLAYPAADGRSRTWTLEKKEGMPVEQLLDSVDFPVRSLVLKAFSPVCTQCELETVPGGGGEKAACFLFDRSNPALNVGFDPYAPVTVALPAADCSSFVFRTGKEGAGKLELTLSEIPYVERFAEKSLAKMYQYPLPMWDEYMWEAPAEPCGGKGIIRIQDILDVTDRVERDTLVWKVPEGHWCIMSAYLVPTGVTNSPAVPEATGLEVDKMSRKHVRAHFDAYIGKILERIPEQDRRTFKVVVQDSYETGGTNWTDDMEEAFRQEYGYDPVPFLPVLQGRVVGSMDISERFLWDLRRLVADRVAYEYVGGLREVCHEHGLETWLENYGHWGFPGEFLMYGGQSDQVSGEFWSEGTLGDIENRAASSCGHIYGKRQIWAESCTSGGPAFSRYPRMMKQRVDRFFTEGINSTLLHLYIQQPDDRKPGLDAWFGNEFNRNNTWFSYMDLFTSYLKRCNFMLQQGRYVADAAYFIGEDAPKMTGECDPALPYGYSFDYINAEVLMEHSRVEDGKLVLDSGMEYSVLVLPRQKTMRPEVLSRIAGLVRDGLTVTGPAPESSPSLENYPDADVRVRELASVMWKDGCPSPQAYGKGRVYPEGTSMERIFSDMGIGPGFSMAEGQDGILSIHRTLSGEGEIWFVSNQKDAANSVDISLRVSGLVPELWNPVNGKAVHVPYVEKDGRTEVHLDLAPLESTFIVLRKGAGVSYICRQEDKVPVEGPWTLSFGGGPGLELDSLDDWSVSEDPEIRYYSGTGVYRTELKVRKSACKGERYVLDLGNVMVMAKVKVNGEYAGGVWTYPYEVDVTDCLENGRNEIEVYVVNNWMNRLVGEASLPEGERTAWTNINPYGPDSPLQSSGLLGPVFLKKYVLE